MTTARHAIAQNFMSSPARNRHRMAATEEHGKHRKNRVHPCVSVAIPPQKGNCALDALGGRRVGSEPLPELPEGLAPVADRGLFRSFDLTERASVRGIEKDRVVAESVAAAGFRSDLSLDDPGGFEEDAA